MVAKCDDYCDLKSETQSEATNERIFPTQEKGKAFAPIRNLEKPDTYKIYTPESSCVSHTTPEVYCGMRAEDHVQAHK
jgi:hypothetical protein